MPKEAIISSDIGNNCAIGNAYPTFEQGRKYLAPGLFGPCGYGFPAIIGAKIGCPDVPVVGFAGDGAFGISMNEMSSIGRKEWPGITMVIFRNYQWGLGRFLLPLPRRLAGLDGLVLVLRVALLGRRHDGRVDDLAAPRNVALDSQVLAEAVKQLVDQPGLDQRLAEQPDGGGVRHSILEPKVEKAHEREAVADQELGLLVGQIVEALQHQDLELLDRIVGLASRVALPVLKFRLRHRLDVDPEILPRHRRLDRLQRIALGTDRL